jgi:hypothetical protein
MFIYSTTYALYVCNCHFLSLLLRILPTLRLSVAVKTQTLDLLLGNYSLINNSLLPLLIQLVVNLKLFYLQTDVTKSSELSEITITFTQKAVSRVLCFNLGWTYFHVRSRLRLVAKPFSKETLWVASISFPLSWIQETSPYLPFIGYFKRRVLTWILSFRMSCLLTSDLAKFSLTLFLSKSDVFCA